MPEVEAGEALSPTSAAKVASSDLEIQFFAGTVVRASQPTPYVEPFGLRVDHPKRVEGFGDA